MPENKKTILIVEDESDLRQPLKEKLEYDGYVALEAENGKIGLEMALSKHPDLILLDIIMPVMDGMTMLQALRKDAWGKNVPVVILTNLNEAEKIGTSVESGVYDYLVKADWELDDITTLIKKKLG